MGMDRRAALALLAGGTGLWVAAPHLIYRYSGKLEFEPLNDPPGFRRLGTGGHTGLSNPFVGLDLTPTPDHEVRPSPQDFHATLFGSVPSGAVPIAFFTDINCPYCQVLKGHLDTLSRRGDLEVAITWHEWPLLGPTSVTCARAALAAGLQGAHGAFQKQWTSSRIVPSLAALKTIATDIGIDAERMLLDMESAAVSSQLARSDAVARRFGFFGTPGLVIGRTAVIGAVPPRLLRKLVSQEKREGLV